MTLRVALVDYGAGNLTSVRKALSAVGADVFVPVTPAEVRQAGAVVVPGVGHFAATAALDEPWRDAVKASVASGHALLGICLGMQWLFEGSSEAPEIEGLGLLPGRCVRLDEIGATTGLKIPHVGWNDVAPCEPSEWQAGLPAGSQAYFTHSYAVSVGPDAIATTTHGATFASAVARGCICGVQFHPEKSGEVGLVLLANFLRIARGA